MPGSKERWSAEELRRYAKEEYPGVLVKTNKPYSKGAAFIDPDTGEVLLEGKSNYKLMDKVTAPDFEILWAKNRPMKLFDVKSKILLKNYAEKMFSRGLGYIIEAMEISGLKNPRFVIGEDGFPEAIKVGNFEYGIYGMRKRGQLE
jgi:hypothetical protein